MSICDVPHFVLVISFLSYVFASAIGAGLVCVFLYLKSRH